MTIPEMQAQLAGKIQGAQNELDFYQSVSDTLTGVLTTKLVNDAKAETAALQVKLDAIVAAATTPAPVTP